MIFVFGIIALVVVIFIFASASSSAKEAQEKVEHNHALGMRVEAYCDYLRRTSEEKEIQEMSDKELYNFISRIAQNYHAEKETSWLAILCAIGCGGFGAFVGVSEGSFIFFSVMCVVGLGCYVALSMRHEKKVNEKYTELGFEVGKLSV